MCYNVIITEAVSREQLTLPGVSAGSEQGDPVRDGVAKYQVTMSRVTCHVEQELRPRDL